MATPYPAYFDKNWISDDSREMSADVCVYGGTAAGVVAAVCAAGRGKSVLLLHPGTHLGGMTSGGLSMTDSGHTSAVGGLSREFYRQAGRHYGTGEEWCFEPFVAQRIMNEWPSETGVTVLHRRFLDEVRVESGRLSEIRLLGGLQVKARVFIDATYEGDLMAKAGVSCTVGREDNRVYGESLNGAQLHQTHQFDTPVDPYVVEGDPSSGLLPQVEPADIDAIGTGDRRIQAYNFRVCMTRDPANRVPFPKPAGYDPRQYKLCARWLRGTRDNVFRKFDRIRGKDKTDTNNHGAVSTDFIGANYRWPEAGYEERERIFQAHVTYQQGLHWFMANDPSVPAAMREEYAAWGLSGDEFIDTGHWPHQLYVREARRMVGDHVVTEHVCMDREPCPDPVGQGSYQMDSHNCRRIVRDGRVLNEGDVQYGLDEPYPISYRAIVPRKGEFDNLAVPVCVSASHIAFGSIRMEPVFMLLAESAAIAGTMAMDNGCALQDLPYDELAAELLRVGQRIGDPAVA